MVARDGSKEDPGDDGEKRTGEDRTRRRSVSRRYKTLRSLTFSVPTSSRYTGSWPWHYLTEVPGQRIRLR